MKSARKTKRSTKPSRAVAKRASPNGGAVTVIPPLTASGLKDVLWTTLIDVRDDQMTPGRADAIAVGAREILRTVKTQLQVVNQAKRGVPRDVIDFAER